MFRETAETVELSIGRDGYDRGSLLVNEHFLSVTYLIVHVFKLINTLIRVAIT